MELEFWQLLPLLISAPAQLGFVLLYSIPWFGAGEWWNDFVGRALFVKSSSLAFVLVTITISWIMLAYQGVPIHYHFHWNDMLIYDKILYVGYWGIAAGCIYQFASIVKLRFKGRPFGDKTDSEGR